MPSQSQPGMMMPRGPQNSMVRERLKNLTGGQQQQQPQAGFQQMPQQGMAFFAITINYLVNIYVRNKLYL